jgi:NAD(P)-dependent dehydrogenase (short-subunit alcohol dehydrogenase family)
MRDDFEGRAALVTGAGSGIGEACAVMLAERGARVLVADIDSAAGERVATSIGESATPFTVDVSDPDQCATMVAAAVEAFGRLDVAVNNAGIAGTSAPVGEYPLDGWRQVLAVHLDGTFYCCRAEIGAMKAAGGGSIVNMASILGSTGFQNAPAYVAAKHGIVGLTRAAALDHAADGIRVNSVGPGFIKTPLLDKAPAEVVAGVAALHPLGRLGMPNEVAELVCFLASGAASNMTGGHYLVDGGYTAR